MSLDTVPLKWAWKLVSWLPGFIFKKIFKKEWFQKQVIIDVRARHQPVSLHAGDNKQINIWLTITNLTYFDLELDRLIVEFNSAGHQVNLSDLRRTDIQSMSVYDDLYLKDSLTADHITAIEQINEYPHRAILNIHAEFNSKVHHFKLVRTLDGVSPVLYNFNLKAK